MSVSEKDVKLLWGRAASRCAFPDCRRKLTQDKNAASDSFPLGEQAHIVGEKEDSPRGKSSLSLEERDSYFNLILVCPTHHTIIDKNPEDYPVEKLHLVKAQHELWVEQTLSESQKPQKTAADIIYADLIDDAVENCDFDHWEKWAGRLMSVYRNCDIELEFKTREFAKKVFRAIWPGTLPELERALKTLSKVMTDLMDKFGEDFAKHVELEGNVLSELKAHHFERQGNVRLEEKLWKEHEAWGEEVDALVVEATKAANWVADVVRRDINPMFFATKGKFTITYGPVEDLRTRTILPDYTEEERNGIPYPREHGGSRKTIPTRLPK